MRGRISRIFGVVAGMKFPQFMQNFINSNYVKYFKIDMSEFKKPAEYESLTALFTRELMTPRKFDEASEVFISPCDGVCLECGESRAGRAMSIKGHEYSISQLLNSTFDGGEEELSYANIYLSPRDYHRYHAPCDMRVLSALYIPGDLYSVSVDALKKVENLYARNERVVLKCEISSGKTVWLVFVGALNVGKMKFVFDERIQTNAMSNFTQSYEYKNLNVRKGELLGYFELGSTIVIISQKGGLELNLFNSKVLKFGDSIGIIKA